MSDFVVVHHYCMGFTDTFIAPPASPREPPNSAVQPPEQPHGVMWADRLRRRRRDTGVALANVWPPNTNQPQLCTFFFFFVLNYCCIIVREGKNSHVGCLFWPLNIDHCWPLAISGVKIASILHIHPHSWKGSDKNVSTKPTTFFMGDSKNTKLSVPFLLQTPSCLSHCLLPLYFLCG